MHLNPVTGSPMTAPKTQAGDRIGVLTLGGLGCEECRNLGCKVWGLKHSQVCKVPAQGAGHVVLSSTRV